VGRLSVNLKGFYIFSLCIFVSNFFQIMSLNPKIESLKP
jgi:hypothetical protein